MRNCCLVILIVFWCATLALAQPIEPLLESLEQVLVEHNIPGASISIVKAKEAIFSGGIGIADVEQRERATELHLFRMGSVAKAFTAIGIMKLVEQNKVRLSDKVLDIDPTIPIANRWEETHPITVAHLLEHTAGFDDLHLNSLYCVPEESSLRGRVDRLRTSLSSRWKPGTRMSYSNPGYAVAGLVIEKVSGLPYDVFLEQELFAPLEMHSTGFYFAAPVGPPMARGYKHENGTYREQPYVPIVAGPAGELCSNAEDMDKFLRFMLTRRLPDGRKLLEPASLDRIERPMTTQAANAGLRFGYGLGNASSCSHGFRFQGHNGGIDGFGADFRYSRDADFAFAITVNRLVSPEPIAEMICDYFLDDPDTRPLERLAIPDEVAIKYDGFYTNRSPRHQLYEFFEFPLSGRDLKFEESGVRISELLGDDQEFLGHAGNGQFYSDDSNFTSAILLEEETGGTPVFWNRNRYLVKTSKPKHLVHLFLLGLATVGLLAFLAFGIIRLLMQCIAKRKPTIGPSLVLWLCCLSFLLIPIGAVLTLLDMKSANQPTLGGVTSFLGSIACLPLALVSVYLGYRNQGVNRAFDVYYIATAILLTGLGFYLLHHDVIGIQLWCY